MNWHYDNSIAFSLCEEKDLEALSVKILDILYERIPFLRGMLILDKSEGWFLQAEKIGKEKGQIHENIHAKNYEIFPNYIMQQLAQKRGVISCTRTKLQKILKVHDLLSDDCPESIVGFPFQGQRRLIGGIYLESEEPIEQPVLKNVQRLISTLEVPLKNALYISKIKEKSKADIQTLEDSLDEHRRQKNLLDDLRKRFFFF